MVLPQLIQNWSTDYWQVINFILYFALFGIIIKEALKHSPLKDSASKLGVILGLIFAIALSSFEFVRRGIIRIPGISLPTVSGYRGIVFSAGSLVPFLMLIMFIVLTYGVGKWIGAGKKNWWLWPIAGVIVFMVLGNVSPDLSGMIGAGIYNILLTFRKVLDPIIDLVFFGFCIWLLWMLIKNIKMGPVERDIRKKTKEEREQEWIQKKSINKEKSAIKNLEKGLKNLKDKTQAEALETIKDLLGRVQYAETTEEAKKLADAMLSEISSKIDKSKPDRKSTIEVLEALITELKKINASESEINVKLSDVAIKKVEDIKKIIPEKSREIEDLFTKRVDKISKNVKELIDGKNQHLRALEQIKAKIEGLNIQFNTKIDELRRNIEGRDYISARKSCEEAIIIEEHLQKALDRAVEIRDSYVRWTTEHEKRLDVLMANEDALSEYFKDIEEKIKKELKIRIKVIKRFLDKIRNNKKTHEKGWKEEPIHYMTYVALDKEGFGKTTMEKYNKFIKNIWERYFSSKWDAGERGKLVEIRDILDEVDSFYNKIGWPVIARIKRLVDERKPFAIRSEKEYFDKEVRDPIIKFFDTCERFCKIAIKSYKK